MTGPPNVLTCVHVIVVAAVVPNPPLLVPELVGGAVAETAPLRAASEAAVRRLAAAGARRWVAVAAHADGPRRVPQTATGTFAGFGVDVPVALGPSGDGRCLMDQLPMLVAGWLRGQASAQRHDVAVTGELLAPSTSAAACASRGAALVGELDGEPVGLLVLGDGARSHPAPGAGLVDVRAVPFDETVRDALATADIDGDSLPDIVTGERFWGHAPPDGDFSAPGRLYWFRLQRGAEGATFAPVLIDDDSGVGTQVTVGDVTNDALPDIVVSNKKGAFVFVHELGHFLAARRRSGWQVGSRNAQPRDDPRVPRLRLVDGRQRRPRHRGTRPARPAQ